MLICTLSLLKFCFSLFHSLFGSRICYIEGSGGRNMWKEIINKRATKLNPDQDLWSKCLLDRFSKKNPLFREWHWLLIHRRAQTDCHSIWYQLFALFPPLGVQIVVVVIVTSGCQSVPYHSSNPKVHGLCDLSGHKWSISVPTCLSYAQLRHSTHSNILSHFKSNAD